jgi:hypothetical protein
VIRATFDFSCDVEVDLDDTEENRERVRWAIIREMQGRPLHDGGVAFGLVTSAASAGVVQ